MVPERAENWLRSTQKGKSSNPRATQARKTPTAPPAASATPASPGPAPRPPESTPQWKERLHTRRAPGKGRLCPLTPADSPITPANAGTPSSPLGRSRHGPQAACPRLPPGTPAEPERTVARQPGPAPGLQGHGRGAGRRGGGRGAGNEAPPTSTRGRACTHRNGHEVPKGNEVPQVVKVAVAEEELGALQEGRRVLGPRRGLGREHTGAQTHMPAGGHGCWEPTSARTPLLQHSTFSYLLFYPCLSSLTKQSQTWNSCTH